LRIPVCKGKSAADWKIVAIMIAEWRTLTGKGGGIDRNPHMMPLAAGAMME
jgi:hypothetical protein